MVMQQQARSQTVSVDEFSAYSKSGQELEESIFNLRGRFRIVLSGQD